MISKVAYLNQEINDLRACERDELWEMQRVVPMIVKDIATDVHMEIEKRMQSNKLLSVPEAAKYIEVSNYIIRRWLERGKLKNENPSEGNVLISIRQLEDLRASEPNMVMRKQKKVRAVPAGARDFRKTANKKDGTITAPPLSLTI